MIKVLLIGPGDDKYKGGQVTHCKNIVSVFNGSNHFSIVFHANGIGAHDSESFVLKIIRYILRVPALMYAIWRSDLVHINTTIDKRSITRDYLTTVICNFLKVSYIVQIHGGGFERIECSPIVKFLSRTIFSKSLKTLFFCSDILHDSYIPRSKQRVAYNFIQEPSIPELDKKTFISSHIKILYLGRIERSKGIFELVEWLRSTKHGSTVFCLTIAGDGPDRLAIQNECELFDLPVTFTGFIDAKEKIAKFKENDFLILPSYSEAFPYTVIEAMSFGVPVISTPVGAVPNIIQNRKSGFLLQDLSVNAFDDVFDFILHSSFDYNMMSSCFHENIHRYDRNAMIDFFTSVWSEV